MGRNDVIALGVDSQIFPVVVELKTKPLLMKQGEVSALITTEIVEVRTNGDSHQLFFNVSSVPEAGNLYVGDRQVGTCYFSFPLSK